MKGSSYDFYIYGSSFRIIAEIYNCYDIYESFYEDNGIDKSKWKSYDEFASGIEATQLVYIDGKQVGEIWQLVKGNKNDEGVKRFAEVFEYKFANTGKHHIEILTNDAIFSFNDGTKVRKTLYLYVWENGQTKTVEVKPEEQKNQLIPLYRYCIKNTSAHFYTTSNQEVANGKYGYVYEGVQVMDMQLK